MYLNYFLSTQQLLSGLVVSVRSIRDHLVFSLQIEETCTFMNISSLKYHLSVIQKQKTVLPCVIS